MAGPTRDELADEWVRRQLRPREDLVLGVRGVPDARGPRGDGSLRSLDAETGRGDAAETQRRRAETGRCGSPRTIRVIAAASPRLISADYPRHSRGVAVTRLRGISARQPRRRRRDGAAATSCGNRRAA